MRWVVCVTKKNVFSFEGNGVSFQWFNNTPYFAVYYEKMCEDTFISAKIQTFVHKSDSITIFAF